MRGHFQKANLYTESGTSLGLSPNEMLDAQNRRPSLARQISSEHCWSYVLNDCTKRAVTGAAATSNHVGGLLQADTEALLAGMNEFCKCMNGPAGQVAG